MSVHPIPEGFHTVTPYLLVDGAARLIEFLEAAFDATVLHRSDLPAGKVMHAQVRIGDSPVMLSDAREDMPATQSMIYLYVDDVDAVYARAISASATALREPVDEFYGDRSGGVLDPCGQQWWIGARIEEVDEHEMERRRRALLDNDG